MRWPPGLLDPPEDVMEEKLSLKVLFERDYQRSKIPAALREFGWCLYQLGATAMLEILYKAQDQQGFEAAVEEMIGEVLDPEEAAR